MQYKKSNKTEMQQYKKQKKRNKKEHPTYTKEYMDGVKPLACRLNDRNNL